MFTLLLLRNASDQHITWYDNDIDVINNNMRLNAEDTLFYCMWTKTTNCNETKTKTVESDGWSVAGRLRVGCLYVYMKRLVLKHTKNCWRKDASARLRLVDSILGRRKKGAISK